MKMLNVMVKGTVQCPENYNYGLANMKKQTNILQQTLLFSEDYLRGGVKKHAHISVQKG